MHLLQTALELSQNNNKVQSIFWEMLNTSEDFQYSKCKSMEPQGYKESLRIQTNMTALL